MRGDEHNKQYKTDANNNSFNNYDQIEAEVFVVVDLFVADLHHPTRALPEEVLAEDGVQHRDHAIDLGDHLQTQTSIQADNDCRGDSKSQTKPRATDYGSTHTSVLPKRTASSSVLTKRGSC